MEPVTCIISLTSQDLEAITAIRLRHPQLTSNADILRWTLHMARAHDLADSVELPWDQGKDTDQADSPFSPN